MARLLPQAPLRPNGFALLQPASRPQLDSARIVTLSGTIAINLIAAGLLMMPLTVPAPVVWVEPEPGLAARPIKREPVVVAIVPVRDPIPIERRPAAEQPRTLAPADTSNVASAVISDTGMEPATESVASDDTAPASASIIAASSGPAPVQLEYARAPAPAYPRSAQRQGLTGTVMLQVLVGIDGRALEVNVVQSSGHRELDEAARTQVLKRWSFRPATRDGVPVQAMGLVPVQFSLQR